MNRKDTMHAAILAAPNQVRLEKVPLPEPGAGQVRVRLEGCGVCGSNLPPWEGRPWFKYPFAPGAPGHDEAARKLVSTVKAMASVKVVRHWRQAALLRSTPPATCASATR